MSDAVIRGLYSIALRSNGLDPIHKLSQPAHYMRFMAVHSQLHPRLVLQLMFVNSVLQGYSNVTVPAQPWMPCKADIGIKAMAKCASAWLPAIRRQRLVTMVPGGLLSKR